MHGRGLWSSQGEKLLLLADQQPAWPRAHYKTCAVLTTRSRRQVIRHLDDSALGNAGPQADDGVGDGAFLQVGAVADDGIVDLALHDLGWRQEAR